MSTSWVKVSLGDMLRLREPDIHVIPTETYQFAGVFSFGRGVFRGQTRRGSEFAYQRLTKLRTAEFVYPKLMAWEGAFGIVPDACDGYYVSPEFPVFEIDSSRLLPGFLGFYFRNPKTWKAISGASTGTNVRRRRLHPKEFLAREIRLPPIEEQGRIVTQIEELVMKVETARGLRHHAVTETDDLWRTIAAEVFAKLVQSNPVCELQELVTVRGGGTPSKSDPSYWAGSIPWVTPKDMKVRRIRDSITHISRAATQETPARLIDGGAVLIVVRGMILAHTVPSAVLSVPAAINQDMKGLVPNGRVTPEYLCSFFWAMNSSMAALVEKSTHDTRKLETAKLLKTRVPVPSISEQHRIVAALDALEGRVDAIRRLQDEVTGDLERLLPAILDRAIGSP
jgi:type I restriction enzyme S subunit